MAGLMDMFQNMSPEQSQGLMAAAAQMLQQSGPSRTPTNLGQILGGGMMAYQHTEQQAREQNQIGQMRGLQIKGAESDLAAQELARQRAQELQNLTKSYQITRGAQQQPQQAAQAPQDRSGAAMFQGLLNGQAPDMSAPGEQMQQPMGAAQSGAPALSRNAVVQEKLALAQYLRANNRADAAAVEEEAAFKLQPKVSRWEEVQQGGRVMFAPFFEDGTNGAPVPLDVAKKLDAINRGGTTDLVNPITGATVRSLDNSASPDALVSAQTQMRGQDITARGQNMSDARAREANNVNRMGQRTQLINDPTLGPMLVDKGTGQARPVMMNGEAVQGETAAKKTAAAKNLLPLINKAEGLIETATGSYGGAGIDQTARVFGAATAGAQSIAQLRVLEGNIMMAQPRMEGPQSNMDVALYRQMAAQIGDPTVPNVTKKAALGALKSLYQKYETNTAAPAGNNAGGAKFLGFE
jgi:hypothetical protein